MHISRTGIDEMRAHLRAHARAFARSRARRLIMRARAAKTRAPFYGSMGHMATCNLSAVNYFYK